MPLGRPSTRAVVLSTLAASLLGGLLVPLSAEATAKTTICHRTSSVKNPYRRISVSQNALAMQRGHKGHTGGVWTPTTTTATPKWGDVVPDATAGGSATVTVNFDEAGKALWNGTTRRSDGRPACGRTSAQQYVQTELALGATPAEVVDDLNTQYANEDALLLEALGLRSFTVDSLSRLGTVAATTTGVQDLTDTTAVLRGTISLGPSTGVPSFLLYADEALVGQALEVEAEQTSVTQTKDVTARVTGLRPGTPYWYRVVATTDAGTDAEAVLEGEVSPFTTAAAGTTPGVTPGPSTSASASASATPTTSASPAPTETPAPTTSASPAPAPPAPTPRPELPVPPVERVQGRERTETAAQLAEELYPQPRTAKVVVLARSDVYADGLTGSPLAGTLDGPVLLTEPEQLSASTSAALRRVLAADGTVYVLGGPDAVSPGVAAEVQRMGYRVTRIGGVDRYDTATRIADRIGAATDVTRVYLATGVDFPDALSAASAAEVTGGVVLLTRGARMPAVTGAWLAEHDDQPLTAVGGAASAASPDAVRIVGADRYSTAAKVAQAVLPEADGVVMVTGTDFPDGLAGASYAARHDWPMLLVDPRATSLTPGQDEYLGQLRGGVKDLVAIGGPAALPPAATSLVSARLDRPGVR